MQVPIDRSLAALGEQLTSGKPHHELVVVGGAALQAFGLIARGTADVVGVALREGTALIEADPLPQDISDAAERVARDFGLPNGWLNAGPADLLRLGLPAGFVGRCVIRGYGPRLTVYFASRDDQVFLKLYAMVDQGAGRHEADLRALSPTHDELLAAARWARSHDPSAGFRSELISVLKYLGVEDADVWD